MRRRDYPSATRPSADFLSATVAQRLRAIARNRSERHFGLCSALHSSLSCTSALKPRGRHARLPLHPRRVVPSALERSAARHNGKADQRPMLAWQSSVASSIRTAHAVRPTALRDRPTPRSSCAGAVQRMCVCSLLALQFALQTHVSTNVFMCDVASLSAARTAPTAGGLGPGAIA